MIILVFYLRKKGLNLYFAFTKFYNNVYKFFIVYKWQDLVFVIVIKANIFIIA